MYREYANLLTEKTGSIMNEDVLNSFNKAIDNCYKKYENYFRRVDVIDTSEEKYFDQPAVVGLDLTKKVLNLLEGVLMEQIGYIENFNPGSLPYGICKFDLIDNLRLIYDYREEVENSLNVQPIPIAVITNKERTKVLAVKKNSKRTEKTSPESSRYLCYIGGHIRAEDEKIKGMPVLDIIKNTLHREIQEEIGESIYFENSIPFLIYTPDSAKSKRHIAVCFIVETDLENKKYKLTSEEFVKNVKANKSGQALTLDELSKLEKNFESWSVEILKFVFNLKVPYNKQTELFID
ncbi:MAG: NUDIX domain-containing protein [Bacteroidetes bacterium]|nr:NUDIX domain-containing protein [Bacteroidota bacterium]